jgi:GntR family transcriptional regulator
MVGFHVTASSAVPAYMQLVEQVRRALWLGRLEPGDQLPTVREVAAAVAINPNTVLKAYRELEHEGLVKGRPGQGTYVVRSFAGPSPPTLDRLRTSLESWVDEARAAGLGPGHIRAVVESTINPLLDMEEPALSTRSSPRGSRSATGARSR